MPLTPPTLSLLARDVLQSAGYPDLQGAPTVPAPPPVDDEALMGAIAAIAHAEELITRGAGLLAGGHDQELLPVSGALTRLCKELLAELDTRAVRAGWGEAAQ